MKSSIAHHQRQQALAIPGMKALLDELARAKFDLGTLLAKATGPYTKFAKATFCQRRHHKNLAVAHEVIRQIESDIRSKGGACLLDHSAKESSRMAFLVTAVFAAWLVLVGVSKNPLMVFSLPLVAVGPAIAMKATERSR